MSECPWYFQLVYNDTVVVNFAKAVSLLKVGPAHLIVVWHVIAFAVTRDAQINIRDLGVTVYKNDIIVEKVDVQYKQKELNEECNEKSDEAAVVRSLIIVVHLEEVAVYLLVAYVYNNNKKEIETSTKPVPGNYFAEFDRKAKDPPVGDVIDAHQKHKE